MPAQSDRVINLRVQATDDGATGTLTQIGKKAREELDGASGSGGGGFLSQLKSGFGRGSAFTQSAKILQGGGAVLGLSLAGKEIDALADKALTLKKELDDGSKSGGQVAEELAKSIPVYGSLIEAGRKFRSLLDGTADDEARLERENQITKALEGQIEALKRIRKLQEEGEDAARKVRNQADLVGKVDPGKTFAQIRQEREELDRQAEKNRRDLPGQVGAKYKDDQAKLDKLQRDALERLQQARQKRSDAEEYAASINPFIDQGYRDDRAKEAREAEAAAERAFNSLGSASGRGRTLRKDETDEAVFQANRVLNEKRGLLRKQEAEAERAAQQARERSALEHETRMEEIRTKGKQESLKTAGKGVAAEIEGIQSAFRVEQAKLFQGFKENFKNALAGGPDSPVTVGKRFVEQLFGLGQLKEQQVGDSVKAGLKKRVEDALKGALESASSFQGKDLFDWLLRKAGLKGGVGYIDRNVERPAWGGLAAAAQVTQGGSQGYAIAERLAAQAADPLGKAQKSAEDAAKSAADAAKSIDSLFKLVQGLAQRLGVTPAAAP